MRLLLLCLLGALARSFGPARRHRALRGQMSMRTRKLGLETKKTAKKKKKIELTKVPGVTPPLEKKLKGWELDAPAGAVVRLCAATVNERLYVMESSCSCCGASAASPP